MFPTLFSAQGLLKEASFADLGFTALLTRDDAADPLVRTLAFLWSSPTEDGMCRSMFLFFFTPLFYLRSEL